MSKIAAVKETSKALKPIDEVRNALTLMADQFRSALPSQINPDRFIRVAMTAIQQNADLLLADRRSLYGACMKAAQDGLLPDGREAALVIYNTKGVKVVQYMPMVAGILKKVRNSGELASISPHVVYENDGFKYWIDETGEHLEHKPMLVGDRGVATHAYAIAKTKDGGVYIEVMTADEVEATRNVSRAKDNGPWKTWWSEMARKTVIRRLSKRLPMSTDLEDVIRADDELYELNQRETSEPKTKSSRLSKLIDDEVPEEKAAEVAPEGTDASEAASVDVPPFNEFS